MKKSNKKFDILDIALGLIITGVMAFFGVSILNINAQEIPEFKPFQRLQTMRLGASITAAFPGTLNNFQENDIIEDEDLNAIEAKIGADNSTVTSSLDYLIKNSSSSLGSISNLATTTGNIIVGNGIAWIVKPVGTNGFCLTASSTATGGMSWETCGIPTGVTASSVIADNILVRGDGGARGVQGSGITIDDSDNASGFNALVLRAMSAPAHASGTIFYDVDDDELAFYNSESDVKLNIGSEMWVKARNNSGGTINDFTPVYQTGAIGNRATIAKAQANASTTAAVIGISTHQIENNTNGFITSAGTINGVDTDGSPYSESWNDKDEIFLSPTTAGDLTNIVPTGNNITVSLGRVLTAGNNGSFEVKIDGANVTGATTSTDNAIVRFDGTSGKRLQNSAITIDDSGNMTGSGGTLTVDRITGSTFSTIQDMQNTFHSSGWLVGGIITDDGDGTITVSAGAGLIRAIDDATSTIFFADWPAESGANVSLADNDISYIYVEYNSGSPQVIATITQSSDVQTNILLAVVSREGTDLHINATDKETVGDHAKNMILRLKGTMPYGHVSGGILSEVGTRNIALTAGNFWRGLTEFNTSALNTSTTDTFSYYYNDGSWQKIASSTQIDNTLYNDFGVGTSTLSNNKYGVHWVYIEADDDDVAVLFGLGDYTIAEAENAQAPSSVPLHLQVEGILAGKIIIKKSDAAFTQTESAFNTTFQGSVATDHGGLSGLADDDHAQYILVDATRAFTGNLQLGSNWLTNDGGNEGIFILADGKVGIGTSTPATLFTVATTTNIFNVASSGNIGIGDSSPSVALDFGIKFQADSPGSSNGFIGTEKWRLRESSAAGILDEGFFIDGFMGSWTNMLVIDRMTGNVGIGTSTPAYMLSIGTTSGSQFLVASSGIIKDGTWNGDVIDISDYTNLNVGAHLGMATDTITVDDELRDASSGMTFLQGTSTEQIKYVPGKAMTISKVLCSDTGTSTINLMERTPAAPNSGGTAVLSSALTCATVGTASSTSFANATIAAGNWLAVQATTTGDVDAISVSWEALFDD